MTDSKQITEHWLTIQQLVELLEFSSTRSFTRKFKQFDPLTHDNFDEYELFHMLDDSEDMDLFKYRRLSHLIKNLERNTTEYKAYSGILPIKYKTTSGKYHRFESRPVIQLQTFTSRGRYLFLLESLPTRLLRLLADDGKLDNFDINLDDLVASHSSSLPEVDIDELCGLTHRSFLDLETNHMIDWITIYQDHLLDNFEIDANGCFQEIDRSSYTDFELEAFEDGTIIHHALIKAGLHDGIEITHKDFNCLPLINDGYLIELDGTLVESFAAMLTNMGVDDVSNPTEQQRQKLQDLGVRYTNLKSLEVEGSYDTSLYIRCDGLRVSLSGNIGAFGRPDNTWGFSFEDTIKKCNYIVECFGLPPFSVGKSQKVPKKTSRQVPSIVGGYKTEYQIEDVDVIVGGAKITCLHVTSNFSLGSQENINNFLSYVSGLKLFRQNPQPLNLGSNKLAGCGWGYKTKYVTTKLYSKALEIAYGKSKKTKRYNRGDLYLTKLFDYCTEKSLLRFELELKSKYLIEHNLNNLNSLRENQHQIDGAFKKYFGELFMNIDELKDLPLEQILTAKELSAYYAWTENRSINRIYKSDTARSRAAKSIREKLGVNILLPHFADAPKMVLPEIRFQKMILGRCPPMPGYETSDIDKQLGLEVVY